MAGFGKIFHPQFRQKSVKVCLWDQDGNYNFQVLNLKEFSRKPSNSANKFDMHIFFINLHLT